MSQRLSENDASAEWRGMVRERRKSNRYQLAALVFASWRQPDGRLSQAAGITRNISVRGISFLSVTTIDLGAYIELDVYLSSPNNDRRGVMLHGEGTIVRVESLGTLETKIAAEVFFEAEPEATFLVGASSI